MSTLNYVTANRPAASRGHPLLWALFLGASWTWVIGMFVPVLLVRDHGLWGWLVFAVPNVVGAAAMGWVLRDAAASERFVRRHLAACYGFSIVTIAYHVFFAGWMIERLRGWGVAAAAIYGVAALLPGRDLLRWLGAFGAMSLSFAAWWMLHQQGVLAVPPTVRTGLGTGQGVAGALLMLPAFLLGFGLCPYLDLTFHRARQCTSPGGGRVAFGVGFGVVFCSMIVFTLLYARWLAPAVAGQPLGQLTTTLLCAHLIGQSAFTVAAHARELPGRAAFVQPGAARTVGGTLLFVLAGAFAIGWLASNPARRFGAHDFGEAVYWCFLGFYGLVFPGYLWLHGFPGRADAHVDAARARTVLLAVVFVAFPMYWMGFVEGQGGWLLLGFAVLMGSRLLVPRVPEPANNGAGMPHAGEAPARQDPEV